MYWRMPKLWQKVPDSNPLGARGFSVISLHVLSMSSWVLSRYSSLLPHVSVNSCLVFGDLLPSVRCSKIPSCMTIWALPDKAIMSLHKITSLAHRVRIWISCFINNFIWNRMLVQHKHISFVLYIILCATWTIFNYSVYWRVKLHLRL